VYVSTKTVGFLATLFLPPCSPLDIP
jgi:hypothetical protein